MARLFSSRMRSRRQLLIASDAFLIFSGLLLATSIGFQGGRNAGGMPAGLILKVVVVLIALMLCMYYYDLYESYVLANTREVAVRLTQVLGTTGVALSVLYYAYPPAQLRDEALLSSGILVGVLLVCWRSLFLVINRSPRLTQRIVLLGYGPLATSLAAELKKRPELGMRVVGYVGDPPSFYGHPNGIRRISPLDDLLEAAENERADQVVITMNDRRGRLPLEALLRLKSAGVMVEDGADFFEMITGKVPLDSLRLSWLVFSSDFRVSKRTLFYKRAFSIGVASLLLLIFSPLMLLIAALIRMDSRGPAIFRQARVGKDGTIFTLFKFRTMRVNADNGDIPRPVTVNDDRLTRVGLWLRRTRMDELPQLVNVLRGDIYFVGPRPFATAQEEELVQKIPFYRYRWTVKPGATGWAQIQRPYCATLEDNVEKLAYDLFYIKNMSVGLDLLILFHTAKTLLLGRGAR